MKTKVTALKREKAIFWYVLVNSLLLSFTLYVHFLLNNSGTVHGDSIIENTGLWLLVVFKFIGTNLILSEILKDHKITKS